MDSDHGQKLVELFLAGRPATTRRAYRRDLDLFRSSTGKPLSDLGYEDLVGFLEGLAGSANTRARRASTIRSFLRFAHRIGRLPKHVFPPCPKPANHLHERILTEDEVKMLIGEMAPGRDRCLVRLLYVTGLRISEALDLRWHDVRSRWISVTGKGSRTRSVLVPKSLLLNLDELRLAAAAGDHVFRNGRGGRLSNSYARRIVRRAALEALDKPVSPHWFRHAHACHALEHGAPIHLVAKSLGHASISATAVYLHTQPDQGSSQYLSA